MQQYIKIVAPFHLQYLASADLFSVTFAISAGEQTHLAVDSRLQILLVNFKLKETKTDKKKNVWIFFLQEFFNSLHVKEHLFFGGGGWGYKIIFRTKDYFKEMEGNILLFSLPV